MGKVLGVGGVFFKSKDPQKLIAWYSKYLHIEKTEYGTVNFLPVNMPENSLTVFSPFPADTNYFEPSDQNFMFNLVVDDLDEVLKQVQDGGAELSGEVQEFEYGRFGWFIDPDGNKVELWEPIKGEE